jgi:substrate-binding family protein
VDSSLQARHVPKTIGRKRQYADDPTGPIICPAMPEKGTVAAIVLDHEESHQESRGWYGERKREPVAEIERRPPGRASKIVSLRPDRLADIWQGIRQVARALGCESKGESVVAELRARIQAIAEVSATARYLPRVASIEWIDPLMAGGNWMPELVEMAGGENLFGQAGQHSPWLQWDELVAADPDVIVVHPCGFDILHSLQDMPLLAHRPGWRDLKAVREA